MSRKKPAPARPGIELADDALLLLRRAPARLWCAYYLGSMPFVLGLMYFWADMSRGAYAREHVVAAALGISLLYLWMKCWQALFAAGLRAHLAGELPAPWTTRRLLRLIVTHAALQPWGLILRPIALLITLPYGWVRAFFENALVFGDGLTGPATVRDRAIAQAKLWPRQNHLALVALFGFAIFVWLNIGILIFILPIAVRMFLGVETPFSLNPWSMLNSTFWIASFGLTYLCTNPILKALYALRCFYGEALATGDDLRIELKNARSGLATATTLAAAFFLLASPAPGAPTPAPAAVQVEPAALNRAIEQTLERPEYAWRMPREKLAAGEAEKNWFISFIESVWRSIKRFLTDLAELIAEWFLRFRPDLEPQSQASGGLPTALRITVYILIGTAVLALGFLLWRALRHRRKTARIDSIAVPIVPDLTSDELVADQLPADGWLRLAREMMERGDLRLALRAFYLAGLAHLGQREMISIARHKSNRDYERELRRRARSRPDLVSAFNENMLAFERAWYGLHDVTAELLHAFTGNLERIRAC